MLFSFWPSLALLAFFLVIFLECRVIAGRVTMPLGGFVAFFAYGCVGAALFSLLLQQLWFLQFAPVTNALGTPIWPAAWWVGPPIEELAKVLPVILLAFITSAWRRLSIADLTLAGFAAGAGFGFVEANLDALATGKLPQFQNLFAFGYQGTVSVAGDYGVYFAGHAVYPALFALACGIGLRLYPIRQALAWIPAAVVFLLCCFDHGMYNWKVLHPAAAGGFADAVSPLEYLYLATLHGRIEIVLLPLGLILAQLAEARLCTQVLGRRGDLLLPYEFGRWVVNEWTVAMMRLPFGCAAFDQTLAFFRRRRAFMLASLEVHRTPANRTLMQYTLLLEQRLLQERALLASPPKGTWFPPRASVQRNLKDWAWRMRFAFGFALLFVLLFMFGATQWPAWLHTILGSDLFTFAMVEGGLCFVAWRIYSFLHAPALDPVACEGAAYADHHMRILLLSASLACGISPALSILFGWKVVAPGAAYLSGYFAGWIGQGGNLYSAMGLGAMGGAMEADPGPIGGALREEIEAGAVEIRRIERQIQKKIASALPGSGTLKLADLVALTAKLDAQRDMQGRRIRALKALERQDAEGRVGDFGAAFEEAKQEFEELWAEFETATGEELRRVAAFQQGFDRYLAPILEELDGYGATQDNLRRTLADLWRPKKDLAWALRVAQCADEAPFDALKDFVADLERIARQASGEDADILNAAVAQIRSGPHTFARPEEAPPEIAKPDVAAEAEARTATPSGPEEPGEPELEPHEPEDQEAATEEYSPEPEAAAPVVHETEPEHPVVDVPDEPQPVDAVVEETTPLEIPLVAETESEAEPLGAADPEPEAPPQIAAPAVDEVWFIEPALSAPASPQAPHPDVEVSAEPPGAPRLYEAFDIEWVTVEEPAAPEPQLETASEPEAEPEVQDIALVAIEAEASAALIEIPEPEIAPEPAAKTLELEEQTQLEIKPEPAESAEPAEAKKESSRDAFNELVRAIKDDLYDHLGLSTPPEKVLEQEAPSAPEARAEPEDTRASWAAPSVEDAPEALAREYLPAEPPQPKEPERQTPLSIIAPGWSQDDHDNEHRALPLPVHSDGHEEDHREVAFTSDPPEDIWHAHLKEFVDLPRLHATASPVALAQAFEPDLPRVQDKTKIAAYMPVSTALPEPRPENYFTADPDLPRAEDKTKIAAYVPVSTALPEPRPENYFTADPDLPRVEDKTKIAAYVPISTALPEPRPESYFTADPDLPRAEDKTKIAAYEPVSTEPPVPRPAAPKDAGKDLNDILSKLHKLEEANRAVAKPAIAAAKLAAPPVEQEETPKIARAAKPAATPAEVKPAAPAKPSLPPADDGIDLWRQTVEGFDINDDKVDATDTGLRSPFEAKLPPPADKGAKPAEQKAQAKPTKLFGVPKPPKPEPMTPAPEAPVLARPVHEASAPKAAATPAQTGSASFRPTKFYGGATATKTDGESEGAARAASGYSTSIRSSKFYNNAKSTIDEADKTPTSAADKGSSTKSPLAEALNDYFAKSGESPPPMHTVDSGTLTDVMDSGRLETTRKGAQPWTFSGIPRRGDYAIRLKRGADRHIEFVPSNVTFGQTPRYYPRRVGVGTAQTYIPIDHLEYFDSGKREWLPMKAEAQQ